MWTVQQWSKSPYLEIALFFLIWKQFRDGIKRLIYHMELNLVAGNGTMLVTSGGDALLLDRSQFSSRGTDSILHYSPKSELDFGVVACWASNSVGNQRDPCLYHVVPAGTPLPSHFTYIDILPLWNVLCIFIFYLSLYFKAFKLLLF